MLVSLVEFRYELSYFTFSLMNYPLILHFPSPTEATWENGRLIEDRGQEQIRAYKEREESR